MLFFKDGTLAQLVEQWTENPCVPGSIPGGTTEKTSEVYFLVFFYLNFIAKVVVET